MSRRYRGVGGVNFPRYEGVVAAPPQPEAPPIATYASVFQRPRTPAKCQAHLKDLEGLRATVVEVGEYSLERRLARYSHYPVPRPEFQAFGERPPAEPRGSEATAPPAETPLNLGWQDYLTFWELPALRASHRKHQAQPARMDGGSWRMECAAKGVRGCLRASTGGLEDRRASVGGRLGARLVGIPQTQGGLRSE